MDALDLLTQRSSMPRLMEPGPSAEQLTLIHRAAVRAPDHMALTPYRFIEFAGADRQLLGDVFQQAALNREYSDDVVERAGQIPFRAPLVIACCLQYRAHDKVPRNEQLCSAACATMAMQQAAFAQGLGAIWRTGWMAEDDYVREQLECGDDDEIVGFLYIGTPAVPTPIKPEKDPSGFFLNPKSLVTLATE
ncbi:NAD(P)H nitroreductase [Idiomarina tyrosinivorans]|uniref:Putative NAD(P)H nitroreductase n=1 Tax=Idiomarina tyrosinivorans TaxID=1445662 RepID=A0A432ZTS8_9GAMM|nr:NAD(P)H nitroreductase [Idiomarina tyrosinivorans]RUO81345.1 NAD(P)H nitroreductase [Idiomarina tyrosinivorans]